MGKTLGLKLRFFFYLASYPKQNNPSSTTASETLPNGTIIPPTQTPRAKAQGVFILPSDEPSYSLTSLVHPPSNIGSP